MNLSRLSVLFAVLTAGLTGAGTTAEAQETQRTEALGIVNGNMTANNAGVEIRAFLSGQPLFTRADTEDSAGSLLIEQAQLVSADGDILRIQRSFPLSQNRTGQWQLPVQVRVQGKAVTVSAQEISSGVQLTLPSDARSVTLVPAGAVQLSVPADYRGDISVDLRVTGGQ